VWKGEKEGTRRGKQRRKKCWCMFPPLLQERIFPLRGTRIRRSAVPATRSEIEREKKSERRNDLHLCLPRARFALPRASRRARDIHGSPDFINFHRPSVPAFLFPAFFAEAVRHARCREPFPARRCRSVRGTSLRNHRRAAREKDDGARRRLHKSPRLGLPHEGRF